ncbi:MAG: hypothetical protein ACLFTW_13740, partial [Chitinispirillaceae bacterium]
MMKSKYNSNKVTGMFVLNDFRLVQLGDGIVTDLLRGNRSGGLSLPGDARSVLHFRGRMGETVSPSPG